jgi:DNA primase
VTWEDVIAKYGLTVHRVGGQFRGPCPIHRGTNPTCLAITPGKGFICFACGVGGGIAQFILAMGDTPDWDVMRSSLTTANHADGSFWHPMADAGPRTNVITPLGPLDPSHPYFRGRGIHEATARFFGMGYFRGTPPFGGRIITPLHNPDGALVGHIARALDDTEPRYRFQQGVPRQSILFNLHRVKAARSDVVVLVEGVFDAAAVYQLGIPNVVASLGCHVSANQRALLSRFRRVLILFDDDRAGADAMCALEAELGSAAVPVALPKADPCSIKGVLLADVLEKAGVGRPR